MVVGIDFRPQTGQLYVFGVNASANTGTLYLVEPNSGVATGAGPPGQIVLVDGAGNPIDLPAGGYGMDFNPTVDRIRITTDTGLNFRINPTTGAPVDGDAGAAGINPDGSISGGSTGVSANAYTNSYGGALVTTHSVSNSLLIQNPPNAGTQTAQVAVKLAGSTLDFTSVNSFDIPAGVTVSTANSAAAGFGFAGLTVGGVTSLYTINLVSGEATNLGAFGFGNNPKWSAWPWRTCLSARPTISTSLTIPATSWWRTRMTALTVTATIHYGLTPNVEALVLQGDAMTPLQGYGNELANNLTGSDGANLLNGLGGVDTMAGGLGDDVYFVDDSNDQVIENPGGGNDAVFSTANFQLSAEVESLVLQGGADLQGVGNSLNNQLHGNGGNNVLDGGVGADAVIGFAGNDLLDGGAGADVMIGGQGDDSYVVDAGDVVIENASEGIDTVLVSTHYALTADVDDPGAAGRCDDAPATLRHMLW